MWTRKQEKRITLNLAHEPPFTVHPWNLGNIAFAGADLLRQEYGISDENYEAVLVLNKNEIPLQDTSLIWYQSDPGTKIVDSVEYADDSTADYRVLKSVPSLNNDRFILAKVVK